MPWVGFEPMIPAFKQAKTVHALDCAATVISFHSFMYGLFKVAVSSWDCMSNGTMINKYWIWEAVEGSSNRIIWGTIPLCGWRNWRKKKHEKSQSTYALSTQYMRVSFISVQPFILIIFLNIIFVVQRKTETKKSDIINIHPNLLHIAAHAIIYWYLNKSCTLCNVIINNLPTPERLACGFLPPIVGLWSSCWATSSCVLKATSTFGWPLVRLMAGSAAESWNKQGNHQGNETRHIANECWQDLLYSWFT
jgi:hypothetical protein